MSLKFYIHATNHDFVDEKVDRLNFETEYERTDLGFKGIIHEDNGKDSLIDLCDSMSDSVVSLLIVKIDDNGDANGIGYNYRGQRREIERESRGNNPRTWHGIAYDGMQLDAEKLY